MPDMPPLRTKIRQDAEREGAMTDSEYQMAQDLLIGQAKVLSFIDWTAFLARIERADSIGAIIDPTLYRKGAERLYLIRDVARQAQGLVMAYDKLGEYLEKERRHEGMG